MRGFFVTFEGGEGTGKSTQIRILDKSLNSLGFKTLLTREPGGSTGAEATRHVLLSGAAEKYGAEMEALLFAAARNDHVRQVIRPAIASGRIVLCDRFMDSSRVYQGVSGKLDRDFMANLERVAVDGQKPDLTIMLDLDPVVGLQRAASRGVAADRYEKENLALHEERRKAFLAIAKAEPDRCVVVNAGQNQSAIARIVLGHVVDRIAVQKA